ncbi:hypothetical protein P4115_01360 [Pseudomonas aeruginosa]|nr:hypothetical protein [Pseudomonas aeruginosa]
MPKIARHTGLIRRSICGCWAFQCLYIQYTPYSPRVTRKSTLILPREVTKKCARRAAGFHQGRFRGLVDVFHN